MALTDLEVFSQYVYQTATEVVAQEIEKFNAASRNSIVLRSAFNQGDYAQAAFWKKISGLVRRRSPYSSGAVATKTLEHLLDVSVKVAAGTPPVLLPPSQFRWIRRNPQEGGVVVGQQLAKDMMADMLNTALKGTVAAMSQTTAIKFDATAETIKTLRPLWLNKAAGKFGDRMSDVKVWVVHSTPMTDFYSDAIANAQQLYTYGTINVMSDPFGRLFVVTDSASLVNTAPAPDQYYTLGLVPQAVIVEQNDDFDQNIENSNGDENLQRSYQAEWSYNLAVKGYAWDKTNGGAAPNDAAIGTSTNWDKFATSDKDGPGVFVLSE